MQLMSSHAALGPVIPEFIYLYLYDSLLPALDDSIWIEIFHLWCVQLFTCLSLSPLKSLSGVSIEMSKLTKAILAVSTGPSNWQMDVPKIIKIIIRQVEHLCDVHNENIFHCFYPNWTLRRFRWPNFCRFKYAQLVKYWLVNGKLLLPPFTSCCFLFACNRGILSGWGH